MPDRHDVTVLSAAGMRTFIRISERWGLNDSEAAAVIACGASVIQDARHNREIEGLTAEQLQRLSLVLGIYRAINILLPVPARADVWLHRPNSAEIFGGRTPLELMSSNLISDIVAVRKYVDAQLI